MLLQGRSAFAYDFARGADERLKLGRQRNMHAKDLCHSRHMRSRAAPHGSFCGSRVDQPLCEPDQTSILSGFDGNSLMADTKTACLAASNVPRHNERGQKPSQKIRVSVLYRLYPLPWMAASE